ncbi:MAG: cytochrome c3 family protein [Desulfosarcina sp.]|nr:cytochrome c3 family protein [Desulfobacterales bacterium]
MTSEKDLKLVCSVAVILFLVGVLCYAAFPTKPPDNPVRIQYRSATGNVLFQHIKHERDYGTDCLECHHHHADEQDKLIGCGQCHPRELGQAPDPEVCNGCHDEEYYEDTEMMAQSDAAHKQCQECHAGIDAGPLECAGCHVQ